MKFTVSGEIGSGKSSVARILSSRVGGDYLSTGTIQREFAKEKGLTTLQLNLLSETDPSIDAAIDAYTQNLENREGALVVDSRMAWFFLPNTIKVFLIVDTLIAAKRVTGDSDQRSDSEDAYESAEAAIPDILARQNSEKLRFQKTYSVDLYDLNNYDLLIDSSQAAPEDIAGLILSYGDPKTRPDVRYWLAPPSLFPTQSIDSPCEPEAASHLVKAARLGRQFFVVEGHEKLMAAIREGIALIPCEIVAADEQPVAGFSNVREFVKARCRPDDLTDWQTAHGFRFSKLPEVEAEPCNHSSSEP